MLLDEPFAGIDPIAVGDIQDLVRHLTNRGIGVLITDHNVRETLGLTDRAYIIYAGEVLIEGDPTTSSTIPTSAGSISARSSASRAATRQFSPPSSRVLPGRDRLSKKWTNSSERFLPAWRCRKS